MNWARKNLLLIVCDSAVVILGVFFFYLWSARVDSGTKPEVVCYNNLSAIDGAKQIWALENHRTTNDTPTWEDLKRGGFKTSYVKCPLGGTYTLGRIGEGALAARLATAPCSR